MRSRRFTPKRYLRAWWFWLLAASAAYVLTIGLLRFLLHNYIVVSVEHEDGAQDGRVVLYFSVVTEFAGGLNRLIVVLGRSLLGPEMAVEGWVRTVLVRPR